ncbi:MAG: exosortase system-associated protein, TIGR04073 family [Candidatus Omnitrophota bacterium]|jgi:putative exosortase-associated protein (TIGR04073 family)
MMKRLFLAAVVLSLIVISATPAFCDGPITKLGRGICNMVTFPLEVPEQISRVNNSDGPFAASTVGVLKGFGSAVSRACVGIFEAVTFLFPVPKNYEPILKDPEYFLETSNL